MTENSAGDYPQITSTTGYMSQPYYLPMMGDDTTEEEMTGEALGEQTILQKLQQIGRNFNPYSQVLGAQYFGVQPPPQQKENQPMSQNTRRIVQLFIADPDEDCPLDHSIIHQTEPQFTDLNDQELYFEAGIPEKLKLHNEKRVKWLDKQATRKAGKDIFLEPIKVRNLKMVVVTIAQF
jgi:hypothetical protein